MDEAEQMHTVPEVAREMRVDRETVYRAIRRGELGTPLDPSKLTSLYVKKALKTAGITKPIQPWHGLRETALTASR